MQEEQQVETMLALASVTVLGVLEQGEPQPITANLTSEGVGPGVCHLINFFRNTVCEGFWVTDLLILVCVCAHACRSLLLAAGNPRQAKVLCGSAHHRRPTGVRASVQSSVSEPLTR